tara:strand:- start:69 stop:428 length:360 start_codon:yes stop_codon:yes gene_type:complete
MKVIKFVDILEPTLNEDGEMVNTLIRSDFMLPTILDAHKVDSICPLFTREGRMYKNVSVIKYQDEMFKVLGSIDYINDLRKNNTTKFVGFHGGQQKQKTIEDRTEVKSKPKRRTKRSST